MTLAGRERAFPEALRSPAVLGAISGAALLLFLLLTTWLAGDLERIREGDFSLLGNRDARLGLMLILLAAYLPVARHYARLGALRNLEELRSVLAVDASGLERLRSDFATPDARGSRWAGRIALCFPPLTALLLDRDPGLYFSARYWETPAIHAWQWLLGFWVCWNAGVLVHASIDYARRFSALASDAVEVDLLDTSKVRPFARQGLNSALLWLVLVSIYTFNAVDRAFAPSIAIVAVVALVVAGTALMLPARGIHRRLRQAKLAELARVRAALRGDTAVWGGSAIAARDERPSVADLLAYRAYIDSIREWPFDAPTLLRFALFVAIPVGSWLGGALVERLLASLLD